MTTEVEVKGQSVLSCLYDKVMTNNAGILASIDRLRDAMDRALGPIPSTEKEEEEGTEPLESAVMYQLKTALTKQENLLSTLSKELSRLEEII